MFVFMSFIGPYTTFPMALKIWKIDLYNSKKITYLLEINNPSSKNPHVKKKSR